MARFRTVLAAGAAVMTMAFGAAHAQTVVHDPKPSAALKAAVADPGRPAADSARDENRKPAETLAVAGVKPGDVVAELGSGGGYYTRILAKAVGPKGKVLAVVRGAPNDGMKALAAAYPNIVLVTDDYTKMTNLPEKPDVIWTTENYHDFHNANPDMSAFNEAMFDALKPGGIFYVEDHAAAAGAGLGVTKTLHRIDPADVKTEVTAAGFKLVRTSDILHHAEDNHAGQNAEAAVRGKTDRFMFVFQKP